MMEYHVEALLAGGYAILLVLIAALLEWLARQSQKRSEQYDTAGFRFHLDRDAWECPQGTRLDAPEIDHALRVIQYRVPATRANGLFALRGIARFPNVAVQFPCRSTPG